MKYSEIVNLSTDEIIARIEEDKATLSKLKFAHAVSAIENPLRIQHARKAIARLQTELTKRKATETQAVPETETAAETK